MSFRLDSCGPFGPPILTRREMLRRAGMGFGTLALLDLLRDDGLLAAQTKKPRLPSFPAHEQAAVHVGITQQLLLGHACKLRAFVETVVLGDGEI